MGKFDNALIFSDIDGTYLGADRRSSTRNDEAIRYFQSEGGLFTFATGRMVVNVPFAIPQIAELANFPVILSNGASLYDYRTNTRLCSFFMDPETVMPIMEYAMKEFPHVGIRATVPGGFLYPCDHPMIMRDMARVRDVTKKLPPEEWDLARIYKIVFRGTSEELRVMQDAITERFGEELMIILSEVEILEVQRKDVSKGNTIEMIREGLKERGTPKKIFAIGDYENDLEMLRAADFAVCPENAIDRVKAVCPIQVCHCDEGAVAALIEYIDAHPELLQ